ncbi:MAG TPA: response regulator transcription factor [Methylococcaceae bacterium]|nr:response regulator transcription factor [Methylococcaceae bacterium]
MRRVRILLVDDHAVVRAGYRLLLSGDPGIVVAGEAASGEEACAAFQALRPEVVILDLSLPGIGGLETLRRLKVYDPGVRVLVFSMHDEPVYVSRALEAGARGYMTKSGAPELLAEAVRKIAAGGRFLDPSLEGRVDFHAGEDRVDALAGLSSREFDVFRLLASGATVREAAERLHLTPKTVANYATSVKSKLDVRSVAEMARLAMRTGVIGE